MRNTTLALLSALLLAVTGVSAGAVVVSSLHTNSSPRTDGVVITGSYYTTISGHSAVQYYTTTYFPATKPTSTPATWASVGDYATAMPTVSYTVITTDGHAMRIPVTTLNPDPDPIATASAAGGTASKGSNHIALIVALPVTLGIASLLVGALFFFRKRNQMQQRRRVNHWASRMAWIPDRKQQPEGQDVEWTAAGNRPASNDATPLSPLQPAHQRQRSIG